jgi:hypothetical protein
MLTDSPDHRKIRSRIVWGLVFCFLVSGCFEKKEDKLVSIEWEGRQAKGLIIPLKLLPRISSDSVGQLVHINLKNSSTRILGEYIVEEDKLIFRPLIAFTRGLKYEIRVANSLLREMEIPLDETVTAPEVIAIYPTSDTVPLNLLKIYIAFSKPMQEGQSLNYILVIKNRQDTIPSVFLDLQPELWNKERTILTLWLDPGRIKRDLQPNQAMGTPLEQGANYQILIHRDWRDTESISLANEFRKEFRVGARDSFSPVVENWTIRAPKPGNSEALTIYLHEPLDYILLKNAVRIIDSNGNVVNGIFEPGMEETILNFNPSVAWHTGDYTVEVESRLEDLAGNNLNRLFDRDITQPEKKEQQEIYKKAFQVQ